MRIFFYFYIFRNIYNNRRLKMKHCVTTEIPDYIFDNEYQTDKEFMKFMENKIKHSRSEEDVYVEAFKLMIQMEEANNSLKLKPFNLTNVRLETHSNSTFKIWFNVSLVLFIIFFIF